MKRIFYNYAFTVSSDLCDFGRSHDDSFWLVDEVSETLITTFCHGLEAH